MKATETKKSLPLRKSKDTELFTDITDKQALRYLKQAMAAKKQLLYPNLPEHAITTHNYEDRTANGLTKCILDYLNSQDHCHAERISNEGVMRMKDGKAFRATSSMQNGTADISCTVWGRSVKIEIKIGNDRQSEAQKQYQRQIENAKGYYLIVKNFSDFLECFNAKMEEIKTRKGGQNGK